MTQRPDIEQLSAKQLRHLAAELFASLEQKDRELQYNRTLNEKLTHELALLKRHRFARRSEQFDAVQGQMPISPPSKRSWRRRSPSSPPRSRNSNPSACRCRQSFPAP